MQKNQASQRTQSPGWGSTAHVHWSQSVVGPSWGNQIVYGLEPAPKGAGPNCPKPGRQLTWEPLGAAPARARLRALVYGSCECLLPKGSVGFVAAAAAATKQTLKLRQLQSQNASFRGKQTESPPQTIGRSDYCIVRCHAAACSEA